jgi:hypothetical protein
MKKYITYYTLLICSSLWVSCGDENIETSKVITLKTPAYVIGDGTSTHTIRATLDPKTDKTLRKIIFRTTHGSFAEAPATEPKKVIVDAKMYNEELFAEVTWKVPASTGYVEISVEPGADDLGGLYVVKNIVDVDTSAVSSIALNANAFSVFNNFNSEVTLTGVLTNEFNKGVSSGTKVLLEDYYASGEPVNGRFRNSQLSSNSGSLVSAIYSPGPIVPDQDIFLTATVLSQEGIKTSISSTIRLYVNKQPN